MNGMDMLIKSAMKAAGIDVEAMLQQFLPHIQLAFASIENVKDDMAAMHAKQIQIDAKLDAIMQQLGVEPVTSADVTVSRDVHRVALMAIAG